MTHSTLTWFSGSIEPTQDNELFLLATHMGSLFINLYLYDKQKRMFTQCANHEFTLHIEEIGYWAYISTHVGIDHRMTVQSQIPEEK